MSDYSTPAHHAVENEDVETLSRLLADGADPDEVFGNMTLLTHAIDTEGDGALQSGRPLTVHTTAVLLAFGADPELAGPGGHTPLGLATSYDHDLAAQLLRTHISKRAGGSRSAAVRALLRRTGHLLFRRVRPR
ncbi:ankyrin repeat domain-containing protein [Streptomyces hydrogenans]|uniref:ankyrin repeat domain-containing protein n=1 Tax=Streptomyces hydrogenans TaxID=1873719 RepID=UPI00363D8223